MVHGLIIVNSIYMPLFTVTYIDQLCDRMVKYIGNILNIIK
jgi:hypothetical protein